MARKVTLVFLFLLFPLGIVVVTSTAENSPVAEEAPKYQPGQLSEEEIKELKGTLGERVAAAQRIAVEHDSDPLRGALEKKTQRNPETLLATASIVVDDGSASFITLFNGTAPTFFWGNTFTNPGTGTFTVASVTPFVNAAGRADTFFCTSATQFRGDGVATVAAVVPGGATTLGAVVTAAIPGSGFLSVPLAAPGPPGSSFVAGHLIDAVDCGGGTSTANHFGEFVFFDVTATGGGSGTGLSNAFAPGGFTSAAFTGGTRTIFTRATIVGPNVPVELTNFSVD